MKRFLILVLFSLLSGDACLYAQQSAKPIGSKPLFNQETHEAKGYGTNAARVDSQITLKIPEGKAQEVFSYIKETYAGNNDLLKNAFPALDLKGQEKIDIIEFTDEYFDTPNLDLYRNKNSVRHRHRLNTTDPNDRKSGRELIQMKVTPPGRFDMRTELKFKVEKKLKNQLKRKDLDNNNQLLRFVNINSRANFKDALTKVGIDPYSLRLIITNHQRRSRVYVNWGNENTFSFSVDEYEATLLGLKASACSVDVGRCEKPYTAANEAKRKVMRDVTDFMVADLKTHFPELEQNNEDKYNILLHQILAQLPCLEFLIKWNLIPSFMYEPQQSHATTQDY